MFKSKKMNRVLRKGKSAKVDSSMVTEKWSKIFNDSSKLVFPLTNRSCYASPEQEDFGQDAKINTSKDKYLQNLLLQQFGFEVSSETDINTGTSKKSHGATGKADKVSQYLNADVDYNADAAYVETPDGTRWQNVEDTEDIKKFFSEKPEKPNPNENIYISEVPQVKVIAEKFTKFKKNNVELRRLEEKIVCVEYDIFDYGYLEDKPVQKMRAFFSIRPILTADGVEVKSDSAVIKNVPSIIKNKFRITNEDLKKLDEREIEIIDGKLSENRPYLEGLKKILKRKKAICDKKNKSSLDLPSLYRMAQRECLHLHDDYSETDFLSKAELEEVKDLILQKCTSSVHGISRTKVRKDQKSDMEGLETKKKPQVADVSQSIFNAVLREAKSQM